MNPLLEFEKADELKVALAFAVGCCSESLLNVKNTMDEQNAGEASTPGTALSPELHYYHGASPLSASSGLVPSAKEKDTFVERRREEEREREKERENLRAERRNEDSGPVDESPIYMSRPTTQASRHLLRQYETEMLQAFETLFGREYLQ